MSTKCIVLGENNSVKQVKKPIKFLILVDTFELTAKTKRCKAARSKPNEFSNIELVSESDCGGLDIMFAYDQNRDHGCLYLGHWNDGVVE